ncbi:MAG: serine hydrolase [Caldilineaceae bacterium]
MYTRWFNWMKAGILLLLISLMVLTPKVTQAQATAPTDADLADQIDQMLAAVFPADGPGAAVLVLRDGEVILRKGYGLANVELGVPIAPEMVFRLGSVAKQFTAMAILMLVEEGKLALDDDITTYLPDYPTQGQTITVEHLLTHTGGVKDLEFLPARLAVERSDLAVEELIALFKDEPLDFAPGTAWSYSNSGYILLGAIIEQVSGMSYADFIQQRIFTPLGMTHSYYDDPTLVIPGRVAGYTRTSDGYANAAYMSMTQPYAAGALASSVDDLAKWDAALYTSKLIKQSTLRRMFKSVVLTNGQTPGYGYGWGVGTYAGHPIQDHNGGINGFYTEVMRLSADKVYIAILSNLENPSVAPDELAFDIATLVIGKPYQDPPAIALPATTLTSYEGVYLVNGQGGVVIRQEEDHLLWQTGGPARVLMPLATDEFFIAGVPLRIRFVKDRAGVVTSMQLQQRFSVWIDLPKGDQPLPPTAATVEIDPDLFAQYVGDYQLGPDVALTISVADGKLFAQATGEAPLELAAAAEDSFFLPGLDVQVEFTRDADGSVVGLVLQQSGQTMTGEKVK